MYYKYSEQKPECQEYRGAIEIIRRIDAEQRRLFVVYSFLLNAFPVDESKCQGETLYAERA